MSGLDELPQWSGPSGFLVEALGRVQAAHGLVELEGIYLPSCPAHAVRARAFLDHRHRGVWRCDARGHTPHALSDIGSLAEVPRKIARKGPLWRGLNPPPA